MASLLTGSRIFVPMATDKLFIKWIGVISTRSHVPVRAVIVAATLGVIYVSSRTFEQLTDAFVVGYFPFYMLAIIAVFVIRKKEPQLNRPFKVPLYPIIPIVFLTGATALLIGAIADADKTGWFSLAVLLIGIPVNLIWHKIRKN